MPREKIKFALRISPETQQLVKEMCPRDNCRTQNEFIERAIRFYAGYVSGQEATAYLPPALASVLRGTVQDTENRICRLLFKLAVELDMVTCWRRGWRSATTRSAVSAAGASRT
jgi:hypothetical protein